MRTGSPCLGAWWGEANTCGAAWEQGCWCWPYLPPLCLLLAKLERAVCGEAGMKRGAPAGTERASPGSWAVWAILCGCLICARCAALCLQTYDQLGVACLGNQEDAGAVSCLVGAGCVFFPGRRKEICPYALWLGIPLSQGSWGAGRNLALWYEESIETLLLGLAMDTVWWAVGSQPAAWELAGAALRL